MESYKLVNSREVQEKAFRLGYKWNMPITDGKVERLDQPFLLLDYEIMTIVNDVDLWRYNNSMFTEITQKDFLALQEPIKIGDWVKCEKSKQWVTLCKVERVNKDFVFGDKIGIAFEYESCTKLTQEQIDILGLSNANN